MVRGLRVRGEKQDCRSCISQISSFGYPSFDSVQKGFVVNVVAVLPVEGRSFVFAVFALVLVQVLSHARAAGAHEEVRKPTTLQQGRPWLLRSSSNGSG